MQISKAHKGDIIFGLFDGITAIIGVLVALLSKGSSSIILAAIGLAVAEFIGMGAGAFLSDSDTGLFGSLSIGGSAAVAILSPVIPWLFLTGTPAIIISLMIAIFIGVLIGFFRGRGLRGYIEALGTLLMAGLITIALTFLTGTS